MKVLITGGAGFVGSYLACAFKRENPNTKVVAFDNLHRRGSERNLPRLADCGVLFIHGDVRERSDFKEITGHFDLVIDASAEPSVHAGELNSPAYVLETNLIGTINCLDFARKQGERFLFLSTSRVYSLDDLKSIRLRKTRSRFVPDARHMEPGLTARGISETFATQRARSFYGASKLCSEMLVQEYAYAYHLPAIINRCGVIAGPGQFGRTDQGVFTLWVAHHLFNRALAYTGFGGQGHQVRDLLHPADLFELILKQLPYFKRDAGEVFNVGGGFANAVSLQEWTLLCRQTTGKEVRISRNPKTSGMDVPFYVTDHQKVSKRFRWVPRRSSAFIAEDIAAWLQENQASLIDLFK